MNIIFVARFAFPLMMTFARKIFFFGYLIATLSIQAVSRHYLDSVLKVVNTTKVKSEKLYCLYTLSFEYGMIEPRKGIQYGEKCLAMALKENDLLFQLNAYNGIANAYETLSKFDSAKYFHRKSYDVAVKTAIPAKIALTLSNMALCSKQLGDYHTALDEYLAGYRFLENEPSYNPRVHFYMSELYARMRDYEKAEYHARRGIEKCVAFGHVHVLLSMNVCLAKCQMQKSLLDSAEIILKHAFAKYKAQTDDVGISLCLNALGEICMLKSNFKGAITYFNEELAYQKSTNNNNGLLIAYSNLAFCTSQLKPIDRAQVTSFLNASIEKSKLLNGNTDILLEWYRKMSLTQEAIGDYHNALLNERRYFRLNDSLMNSEKVHQLLELEKKYETEKKESQIVLLEQRDRLKSLELEASAHQITTRNYFIFSGIVLFLLLSVLAYVFSQKQKQKALFEKNLAIKITEEKERIRMAKDIHDDLGSGLSKINFLSELIASNPSVTEENKTTTRSISETAQKMIVNMRDLIWALDPGNVTLEGLTSRLREYSSDYLEDHPTELEFIVKDDLPDQPISKEVYRSILMTVKESLNNVIKHAMASKVRISIAMKNNILSLEVADNGKGIGDKRSGGNGLNNMRARIESVGGSFQIILEEGTKILMAVPLNATPNK